jgi:hypothetical protein
LKATWRPEPQVAGAHTSTTTRATAGREAIEPKVGSHHRMAQSGTRFRPKSGATHSPLKMSRFSLKTVWRSEPQAAGVLTSAITGKAIGMGAIEPRIRVPTHAWPNPQPRFYPKSGLTHSPLKVSRFSLKPVRRSEPQAAGAHTSTTTGSAIGMVAIEPKIRMPAHA